MRKRLYVPLAIMVATLACVAQAAEPYCREFTQPLNIGGRAEHGYGTACQQPDGSWEIVKPVAAEPSYAYPEHAAYVVHETIIREEPVYYAPPPRISFSFGSGHHRHRDWHGHKHGHGRYHR